MANTPANWRLAFTCPLICLTAIGACAALPAMAQPAQSGVSPQEQAFYRQLGSFKDDLRQQGDVARNARRAPYNRFVLETAGKTDVGQLQRSGDAARAARGIGPDGARLALPATEGLSASDGALLERRGRMAQEARAPNLSASDAALLEQRGRMAQEARAPSLSASDAALMEQRGLQARRARNVGTAARTARTAGEAARVARTARAADEAAKVAKVGRFGMAESGVGLAVVAAPEALKATTGLDVPVTEYAIRTVFTPVVALQGGDGGKYFVDTQKEFAHRVAASSKTFVKTFQDPKQFGRNVKNYGKETLPMVRQMACGTTLPIQGIEDLIQHKKFKPKC